VEEVRVMLQFAQTRGIRVLDTAALYGTSEEVLGECNAAEKFKIVTKTIQFRKDRITREDADQMEREFRESLRKLNRESVYGLLLHNCDDALVPGGEHLLERLLALREKELAERVGVSAYNPQQVERVLALAPIQLLQVPFNAFDQRFEQSGMFAELK